MPWPSTDIQMSHGSAPNLALGEASGVLKLSSYSPIPSRLVCSPVCTCLLFRTKIIHIYFVQYCTSLSTLLFPLFKEEIKLLIWKPLASSPKALSQMDLLLAGHLGQTGDTHIFHSPRPSVHLAITLSSGSVLRDHLRKCCFSN